jgi:hypothetical protein
MSLIMTKEIKPLTDLPLGPKTPGYIHTLICPGCDQEVIGGMMACQPLSDEVIAWWHSACRDAAMQLHYKHYREIELVPSISEWMDNNMDVYDPLKFARDLLEYIFPDLPMKEDDPELY